MEDELKALLDAVNKLQPVLANPHHSSQLKLLREQVERIASLAGAQPPSDACTSGEHVEGAASLAGAQPTSSTRPTGENVEGATSLAGAQPTSNGRPTGENIECAASLGGPQPTSNGRSTGEHAEQTASLAGPQPASNARPLGERVDRIASLAGPEPASNARRMGDCAERLASLTGTQPPASHARAAWDHVEHIASLAGPHPTLNARAAWDHVERVAFLAGAQPASHARGIAHPSDKGITHASDKSFDARLRPKTRAPDEECTELGIPQSGRIYKTGKWSPGETLALVHCKRGHFLKYGAVVHRSRSMVTSASERWSEMEDEMLRRFNVLRSKYQCQEKWEQLATDFKKVFDYQQKNVPLGEPSYFQMTPVERKEHMTRFPKAALDEGVFNALCEWFPRTSQSLDPGDLPNESPFEVTAIPRGGNPGAEAPILEDNRPTLEDGIGDSSSPNSTKRRRFSAKASEGAISAIENNRKESVTAATVSVGQDREDARHRALLEMDSKRHRELLELEARKHQDKIIIEKERLQRSAALGQGYIAALLSIADALKVIGEALKKS